MQLKLIKNEVCPQCAARTVAEECSLYHCNGQGFEERRFECGCVLAWVPNFEQLITKNPCPNDPAEITKETKRNAAKKVLVDFINKLDVDDIWKKNIYMPY